VEQKLSFEQALQRFEQVVKELETGDLSLDSALALFQEGVALARQCGVQLDEAEAKIVKRLEAGRTVEFTTEA